MDCRQRTDSLVHTDCDRQSDRHSRRSSRLVLDAAQAYKTVVLSLATDYAASAKSDAVVLASIVPRIVDEAVLP